MERIDLAEVKENPRNPKGHKLDEIVKSLRRFGFVDAVVIDERTKQLVSGHGRTEALRLMREEDPTKPPRGVTLREDGAWMIPAQRGWRSKDDTEAEALIVALNRLVELGGYDDTKLAAMLSDLAKSDALEGIGYTSDAVEELLARPLVVPGMTDPNAEWEGMPVFDQQNRMAARTLKVHFRNEEDAQKFAALIGQNITPKTRFVWYPENVIEPVAHKAYVDVDEQAEAAGHHVDE